MLRCNINRADGVPQTVVAKDYATVLLYWLGSTHCQQLPPNPQPLTVYQVGPPMPGPDDARFLMLVVAACEALHGTTPDIEILAPDHADYEKCCEELVRWLRGRGTIGPILRY